MADELMSKNQMKPGGIAEGGTMQELFTGSWRTYVPMTDLEKCKHCMICWIMCPDSSILVQDGKKTGTDLKHCKGCGICAQVCPFDAIEIVLESDVPEGVQKG
jgi:pyruvate ferredoxin oxidoreductase delta subunit